MSVCKSFLLVLQPSAGKPTRPKPNYTHRSTNPQNDAKLPHEGRASSHLARCRPTAPQGRTETSKAPPWGWALTLPVP